MLLLILGDYCSKGDLIAEYEYIYEQKYAACKTKHSVIQIYILLKPATVMVTTGSQQKFIPRCSII